MKKIISLILAVVMTFTCFTGIIASAEDTAAEGETSSKLDEIINDTANMEDFEAAVLESLSGFIIPEDAAEEVSQMIKDGTIEGQMLGLTVDYLYTNSTQLFWEQVTVEKSDIALASANLNSYLKRILTNLYGGFKLYTSENATAIANFLGNLFYPNFTEVKINFTGTEQVDEEDFYEAIVLYSGFGELLQRNWCDQGLIDFRPVLTTFGLPLDSILNSEYKDGQRLGAKLLSAFVTRVLGEGPINVLIDLIQVFSKTYMVFLYEPVEALFRMKINSGIITENELKTMDGLVNLIANNNHYDASEPVEDQNLQFVDWPVMRFKNSRDTTETFLYFLMYANINSQYRRNAEVIEGYKETINSMASTDITDEEKARICSILDVLLKGDLTAVVSDLSNLFKENLDAIPSDIFTSFANTISRFLKKIADYFDYLYKLFTGEIKYGQDYDAFEKE